MRIGIDARELTGNPAGKGRYVARIVDAWNQHADLELCLYIHAGTRLPEYYYSQENLKVLEVSGKGLGWHWKVGRRLKKDGVSVYLAALSYLSALVNPVSTVTVVHDLAVFQAGITHNRKSVIVEKLFLRQSVFRSKAVISISHSTARDLHKELGIPEGMVTVIHIAPLTSNYSGPIIPLKERGKYILYVGTLEPRKNIGTLFKAYAQLPKELREKYCLKLAGKPGWGGVDYRAKARELKIDSSTEFLGYVRDEELPSLYANASVFAYPSLYEGFGLPVIEAMAAGTPVITSTNSSLPEVVGNAGILVDATDVVALSDALKKILTSELVFEELSQAGLLRSKDFSWKTTAQEVLLVCKSVADLT